MGSGEWGMGSGEWGMGSGEWGQGDEEFQPPCLYISPSPHLLVPTPHSPFPIPPFSFPLHKLYLVIPKFAYLFSGDQITNVTSRLVYEEQETRSGRRNYFRRVSDRDAAMGAILSRRDESTSTVESRFRQGDSADLSSALLQLSRPGQAESRIAARREEKRLEESDRSRQIGRKRALPTNRRDRGAGANALGQRTVEARTDRDDQSLDRSRRRMAGRRRREGERGRQGER